MEADRESAERMIGEAGLSGGFALVNPGAGWPSKLWPAERYAAVTRHLGHACSLPSLVVWAGPQERDWAEQIVAGSEGHARMAPNTTLTELAALTRRARLFVGSDTGPLHLAAAVGTPCVGLYGPMPAERNGPYGPGHVALQKMLFNGTSRQRRNAPGTLMEAIEVEHVCDACDRILKRQRSEAA
jgi:ADP-heptose:LPS heptosyltransferase